MTRFNDSVAALIRVYRKRRACFGEVQMLLWKSSDTLLEANQYVFQQGYRTHIVGEDLEEPKYFYSIVMKYESRFKETNAKTQAH